MKGRKYRKEEQDDKSESDNNNDNNNNNKNNNNNNNNEICEKLAYFFRNLQSSWANYSRIPRIKNAKFLGYCFYMGTNMWGDFQICISAPFTNKLMVVHWVAPSLLLLVITNAIF